MRPHRKKARESQRRGATRCFSHCGVFRPFVGAQSIRGRIETDFVDEIVEPVLLLAFYLSFDFGKYLANLPRFIHLAVGFRLVSAVRIVARGQQGIVSG